MEAYAACALENTDITLPNPNEVQQVMNEEPEVYDYEDDKEFDINKAKNTKTQVDAEEAVEDK